jgi:hypothetical protein
MVLTKDKFPMPGPEQCHPSIGNERPAIGCLPLTVLQSAANTLGLQTTDETIRDDLEKKLRVSPKQEYSFLKKLPISKAEKDTLLKKFLRPPAPIAWKKDPDMWLDSLNIADVMNQYETAFPNFDFMGPFPIDFAAPNPYEKTGNPRCLMDEICEFRVTSALANKKDMLGVIYNLDPHYKSGSHWVSTFVDLKKNRCMYFDSYGMKPPKQIHIFMSWVQKQDPSKAMKLMYSSRRIQYKNTECGVFCLYFIIRMLYGDEFVDFTRATPNDQGMLSLRSWMFST